MEDIDPRLEQDDEHESEELEAEIMRADHPFASDRFGTTAEEAEAGEGLDRALAQEVPEPERAAEALEFTEELEPDGEGELVADAVRETDPFAAPEEVALQIEDDAPGATDHDELPVDDDVDAVEEYLEETDDGRKPERPTGSG
jgi:hypothetical protein